MKKKSFVYFVILSRENIRFGWIWTLLMMLKEGWQYVSTYL